MFQYNIKTKKRIARPRSERLRELGTSGEVSGSTVVEINPGASGGVNSGHTHPNKAVLDSLSITEGYLQVENQIERVDNEGNYYYERVVEKVNAGYADSAKIAESATEAKIAETAQLAQTAEMANRAGLSDTATLAERAKHADSAEHANSSQSSVSAEIAENARDITQDSPIREQFQTHELIANRVIAREELLVKTVKINQIEARGGMEIDTAAHIEVCSVIETEDSYICYFDNRSGSVANLFTTDDIAYCHRWTPEFGELKSYRRRVLDIGEDFVVLSKNQYVNGLGIPEPKDSIIHYGNYTNKSRQFVKVRDIINGGYEVFLEGLDSVIANGEEFYFVGREAEYIEQEWETESGEAICAESEDAITTEPLPNVKRSRWFIGKRNGPHMEFNDDKLTLNEVSLTVNSKVGEEPIPQYIKKHIGNENLIKNSNGPIILDAGGVIEYSLIEPLQEGLSYTFSVWCSDLDGLLELGIGEQYCDLTEFDRELGVQYVTITPTATVETIELTAWDYNEIQRVKLEKGSQHTMWTSPNYLNKALRESTSIDGGLIATSLIELGYTVDDNFVVQSGINGMSDKTRLGHGIAFWAGGDYIDAEEDVESSKAGDEILPANFVIRHDGTGYMAGGAVKIRKGEMLLGKSLKLSEDELRMDTDDSGKSFVIKAAPTGYGNLESAVSPEQIIPFNKSFKGEQWYVQHPSSSTIWTFAMFPDITQKVYHALQGSKITIELSLDWLVEIYSNSTTINIPSAVGRVDVMLMKDGNLIHYFGYRGQGFGWGGQGYVTINGKRYYRYSCGGLSDTYTITESGVYEIVVRSINPISDLSPNRIDPIDLSLRTAKIQLSESDVHQTIIGSDGFASNWGEALVAVSDAGAILRYGATWLKVSAEGIKYKVNGVEKSLT